MYTLLKKNNKTALTSRYILLVTLIAIFLTSSCTNTSSKLSDSKINLKWNPSHDKEKSENIIVGLRWALSHIGANSDFKKNNLLLNNNVLTLNIEDYNFNLHTYLELLKLNNKIFKSEEYSQNQTIDIGRYITLLIGSSNHYYKFTGVPTKLDALLKNYNLKPDKGKINNSLVSLENRVIQYSGQKGLKQLFLSTETDSSSGKTIEFESLEIMENGQLRFGIFDENGNRKNAGDPKHTKAGKPAKCIWCHESRITPLFTPQSDFKGFLSQVELNNTLRYYAEKLERKQIILKTTVDYSKKQEHTQMELLYISFMEPSARRLSSEWNMSLNKVKTLLLDLDTHRHKEFPFLGSLYNREDVDEFAPYKSIEVSTSVREKSKKEVNHLK